MKRVFSDDGQAFQFTGPAEARACAPPRRRHAVSGVVTLEQISPGREHSPWEVYPGPDDAPPGLYEPFRAGELLEHYGGDLASVLELFADAHPNAYRRGGREDLLMRMRSLGAAGFVVARDGIAVSHPRHPLVLPVPDPVISVCLAYFPVYLGPDGSVPVRLSLGHLPDGGHAARRTRSTESAHREGPVPRGARRAESSREADGLGLAPRLRARG